MSELSLLTFFAICLGLAFTSGISLYLTLFLTGLMLKFGWFGLQTEPLANLDFLTHPAILVVLGVFSLVEWLLDKCPWMDTLWDTVHSVIRPLGICLVILHFSEAQPTWVKITAGLIATSVSFIVHGAKASLRLQSNQNPGATPNRVLSLSEDFLIIGGIVSLLLYPLLSAVIAILLLILILTQYPKYMRASRAIWYWIVCKLRMPSRNQHIPVASQSFQQIPIALRELLYVKTGLAEEQLAEHYPCHLGKNKGQKTIPTFSRLFLIFDQSLQNLFIANTHDSSVIQIPVQDCQFKLQSEYLSEDLIAETLDSHWNFRFPRGSEVQLVNLLERLQKPTTLSHADSSIDTLDATTESPTSMSAPASQPQPASDIQ